jgi:hypothetical protein
MADRLIDTGDAGHVLYDHASQSGDHRPGSIP